MGLDMYAYVASKKGQYNEYYETAEFDKTVNEFVSKTVSKPVELAYWRKHPNLHGWMEKLWLAQDNTRTDKTFNGVELELTWEDIDKLEKDIKSGEVSKLGTTGFFFGNPSDDIYRDQDLQFCIDAKAELFLKRKVFYNSSW